MHPAARVFLIALVTVLVCSHLILNIITDKPTKAVSRHLTVHQSTMEGVNDINTATFGNDLMDRISDMKMENSDLDLGNMQSVGKESKPAVEVVVKQTGDEPNSEISEEMSEAVERDEEIEDEDEDVERKDEERDCDGSDDDDSSK